MYFSRVNVNSYAYIEAWNNYRIYIKMLRKQNIKSLVSFHSY